MNISEVLLESFYKKLEKLNQRLEKYLKEPTAENIHNVRTSFRRLEAAYSIIPRSGKTKSSERVVSEFKDFFSLNSKIRDLDIIREKFTEYKIDLESETILTLKHKKLKSVLKAIKFAEKLSEMKKPQIKHSDKIEQKFQKRISSLIDDFKEYIPIVIKDESNVEEIHSMRKKIKKLRYVLELEPSNSYQSIVNAMKQLQKNLGAIHDCDIFIWYVEKRKNDNPLFTEIISSEKSKRNEIYKKLTIALSSFESLKI